MARFVPFFYMFRDLIPRAVEWRAPLPFLGCCRWWWWGCCCWWGWLCWWWLQRQRRGGWVPFSFGLGQTWEAEAWIYGVVWLVVDEWFWVVLVMMVWNEKALVVETIFRSWSSRFLNSRSCSNFSRPGLKDLTLGGVRCLGGVLGGTLFFGGMISGHMWGVDCWTF